MNKGSMGSPGMGMKGGASMGSRSGGAAMGSQGYGMNDSYDSFDVDTPGPGGYSAARNVQNALSSLSDSVGSRSSRYGQSVDVGSTPTYYDYSKGDRGSSWDSFGREKSLRDAGVKDQPSSALGSIASYAQREWKEIDRYVYEDVDDRPRAPRGGRYKLPQPGSTIGEYASNDMRGYSAARSRYPPQRSESRRGPRRMDDFDSGYDDYETSGRYESTSRGRSPQGPNRGYDEYENNGYGPGPQRQSRDDIYSSNAYGSSRRDGYDSDYNDYDHDDRRYDDAPRDRGRRRDDDRYPPPRRNRRREGPYDDDDEYYDYDEPRGRRSEGMHRARDRFSDENEYYEREPRRRPPPRRRRDPRDEGRGGRPFGVNRGRDIDYQSMNRDDYGYGDRDRRRDSLRRDYEYNGHRGQSLVDYQVRRRGPPLDGIIDVSPRRPGRYDDPYY